MSESACVKRTRIFPCSSTRLGCILCLLCSLALGAPFDLKIEQLTSGTKHHFFGYIGQCQTIPWNASGRYILGLEIDTIDRMPKPEEAATVILVDTQQANRILRVDKTHAWNPQQGTMFYWNPLAPETQFFFNDRDLKTGRVFTVLYDLAQRKRVREYRYEDTPIGNGGVAADGSAWLGLNYGRLARLRLVTGYPEALDWSKDEIAPANDGMFVVDVKSGEKRLLVSYRQLDAKLKARTPTLKHTGLFINHALWNRNADRVYFFVRAGWSGQKGKRINTPCSIHADGTGLTLHETHIGGHPEWAEDSLVIGRQDKKQILYDVDEKRIVGQLGTPEIFPNPEGDIALSPNGKWFVNGYKKGNKNFYVVYQRSTGVFVRSRGLDKGAYSGDIRIDPAPRWNRSNDAILVPGIAKNGTRQMFLIRVIASGESPPGRASHSPATGSASEFAYAVISQEQTLKLKAIRDSYGFIANLDSLYRDGSHANGLPYHVYVPDALKAGRKYPLVIFLHGYSDLTIDTHKGFPKGVWSLPLVQNKHPHILFVPRYRSFADMWVQNKYRTMVVEALDSLIETFNGNQDSPNIDSDRIYLTGFSQGGMATWNYIKHFPNRFAAACPLSGFSHGPQTLAEAQALKHIPIWIFNGDGDRGVKGSRLSFQMLKQAKAPDVRYHEYAEQGHVIDDFAYFTEGFMDWLFAQKLSSN